MSFYDRNINFNKIICHLHGSYLYEKKFGVTYKLRDNNENTDPVMIFNNPDFKEGIIKKDTVLLEYFEILESDLKDADQLIILGNSMTNEPHIKNLISQYGNRESLKIFIFSTNPHKVSDELKEYYKFDIVEINTNKFTTTDVFFEEIQKIL